MASLISYRRAECIWVGAARGLDAFLERGTGLLEALIAGPPLAACSVATGSIVRLPTPVLTGSGSEGLSQPRCCPTCEAAVIERGTPVYRQSNACEVCERQAKASCRAEKRWRGPTTLS